MCEPRALKMTLGAEIVLSRIVERRHLTERSVPAYPVSPAEAPEPVYVTEREPAYR